MLGELTQAVPPPMVQSGVAMVAVLGAFQLVKWVYGRTNGKACAPNVDPKLCQEHIKKLASLETATKYLAEGQKAMALKLDLVLAQLQKG